MDIPRERRSITVLGTVQGVGFRPFVYGLALRFGLGGFVRNQSGRVLIEVEGTPGALDRFLGELESSPPPLSRIEAVAWQPLPSRNDPAFRIEASDTGGESPVFVSPDVATCDDCLAELFDSADRRFGYPFLNCTHCGPRLTIIRGAPYDRDRTTMASFAMCPACRAEYDDPANRRFHAQPTACADCGPCLILQSNNGERIETSDPLSVFVGMLREGKIGALKGLGGFHLVCHAGNDRAVAALRRRKERDEKPFAVMVADIEAAERFCEIGDSERMLLKSAARPIVLLRKRRVSKSQRGAERSDSMRIADGVAPNHPYLGVMLPYTPVHHLLVRAAAGAPLVMTSGNRSDEPIAYLDDEAVARLGGIADIFLTHDRPIHVRCDDSVTRIIDGCEAPIRRSRGYAPQPVRLPLPCPCPILAVGGQLKGVFALGRDRQAFLSHHMGDLDRWDVYQAYIRDVGLYQQLFAITPQVLVHDLHPDYASSEYARTRAASEGLRLIAVQHHHAHMASCMAENGLTEPVIGVSFDGTGLGTDGAIWGGEFLVGNYGQFRRAAHLRYVGMPGGDKAVHEPWRMAVAHLTDAGCSPAAFDSRVGHAARRTMETMLARGFNAPLTSSVGRLFDAVASIAALRDRVSYEGQAALELEWLATESEPDGAYPFQVQRADEGSTGAGSSSPASAGGAPGWGPSGQSDVIDTRPIIRGVVEDVNQGVETRRIARRFHCTIVRIIHQTCCSIRNQTQLDAVALSGGVFMNALIAGEAAQSLRKAGFRVFQQRAVPPNDGGLCLGQLAIAAVLADATHRCKAATKNPVRSESYRNSQFVPFPSLPEEHAHVPRHSG